MARTHTITCGEKWGVWGMNIDPYINYAISLATELSLREQVASFT